MIPKIIHFCWFGGSDYPDNIKSCMATWGKVLKDYRIMRWDENNFDVHCNIYTEQAYERKNGHSSRTMFVCLPSTIMAGYTLTAMFASLNH